MAGVDGLARVVAARMVLETGAVVVLGTLGPSAGARGPASCARSAEEASMQGVRWRGGSMIE